MDYTIQVWSILSSNYAECDCGWQVHNKDAELLMQAVKIHRTFHFDKGDSVEIV